MRLVVGHLYPELMNLYADRGNVLTLVRRCEWRKIDVTVEPIGLDDALDPSRYDLLFIGGGQDREQALCAQDLAMRKAGPLREAIEAGVAALAVCGGYQLFGKGYLTHDGIELPGAGIFDVYTRHPGPQVPRCIGDVVMTWEGGELVGFENHGGRTYLGPGAKPLGRVIHGSGNNGEDGTEGAIYRNAIGTYLHGCLLPKNPALADYLIRKALERRYGPVELAPLDDTVEQLAHASARSRAGASRSH